MKTTLISVHFERNEAVDTEALHVEYTLEKNTPVGTITTSVAVPRAYIERDGVEVWDGNAFFQLGAEANREELNRILEVGATSDFGTADVA
jgi:hypothetical protein